MLQRLLRISAGVTIWSLIGISGARLLTHERGDRTSAAGDLVQYLRSRPLEITLQLPHDVWCEVGDLAYAETAAAGERPAPSRSAAGDGAVGEVCALLDRDGRPTADLGRWTSSVRLRIHDTRSFALHDDAAARLVFVPDLAAGWVINTLVTPDKLTVIQDQWRAAWRREKPWIVSALKPVLETLASDVEAQLGAETGPFFTRHRAEIDRLLARVDRQMDPAETARIFESSIWPIVRNGYEPLFTRIGREIWERFPLWGLTWRAAYQTLPLTRDDYLQRRWRQFVDEEALPLLRASAGDFLAASREVVRAIFSDADVKAAVHELLARLLHDEEFQRLCEVFLREVFIDNPEFRERLAARLRSPEVAGPIHDVSGRLERNVRKIADVVFGTQETGISESFSRVLRAQILGKERRRFLLAAGSPERPPLPDDATLRASVSTDDGSIAPGIEPEEPGGGGDPRESAR